MIVLTGDIGATNSRLAIVRIALTKCLWLNQKSFKNKDFKSLKDVLTAFGQTDVSLMKKVKSACIGIAGPIENAGTLNSKVTVTNLPWAIAAKDISKLLNIKNTWLINDLEAIGNGLDLLKADEIRTLLPGDKSNKKIHAANQAVIAPGSGIGEAILYWDGHSHKALATEGGHCSFSPAGKTQIRLLEHLSHEHNHISWEKVISGPGLYNLYKFLKSYQSLSGSIESLPSFETKNPSALITEQALTGHNELCQATVELFIEILANEAGNLALKSLAYGGIYIAGGIVPKIASFFKPEPFFKAFINKGRMKEILKNIPVHLVLNDKIGMLGAARYIHLQKN